MSQIIMNQQQIETNSLNLSLNQRQDIDIQMNTYPFQKNFDQCVSIQNSQSEKLSQVFQILHHIVNNQFEQSLSLNEQSKNLINFDFLPVIRNSYQYSQMKKLIQIDEQITKNDMNLNIKFVNQQQQSLFLRVLTMKQQKYVNTILMKQINFSLESLVKGEFNKFDQQRSSQLMNSFYSSLQKIHSELQNYRFREKQCIETKTSIESELEGHSESYVNLIKSNKQKETELKQYKSSINAMVEQYDKKLNNARKQNQKLKKQTISLLQLQIELDEAISDKNNEITTLNNQLQELEQENEQLKGKLALMEEEFEREIAFLKKKGSH